MRNPHLWRPTKFVRRGGTLRASRLNPASTLMINALARELRELLRAHARGRLLDLGCGTVPLFEVYRDQVSETVCVDRDSTIYPHVDTPWDLTRPLPFRDGEFDTVLLSDVLEHIPTPAALCAEIGRVLAVGGNLIVSVPFFYWLHEEPHDYFRYTEHGLRRLCEAAGLQIVYLEPFGGVAEIFADICAKILGAVPVLGGFTSRLVQLGAAIFLRTPPGSWFSRRTRRKFPLGYCLVARKNGA